jgi:hypothetical protein
VAEKGVAVTAIGWFDPDIESRSDNRDDASVWLLAAEMASCLRRFVDVAADDGTLLRTGRALAAWDLLVGPRAVPVDSPVVSLEGLLPHRP